MSTGLNILNLLLFHRKEREFFTILTNRLGQQPIPTQWVMSLWLWFESIGHHDFILRVSSSHDDLILRFIAEAKTFLLLLFNHEKSASENLCFPVTLFPLTNTLLITQPTFSLRFFDRHRVEALNGVLYFLNNVSQFIFHDNVKELAKQYYSLSSRRLQIVKNLFVGVQRINIWGNFVVDSMWDAKELLNPILENDQKSREDHIHRSLFITFSRGYPLTRDEIKDFFHKKMGQQCVEMVMIEKVAMGVAPIYGRVVFTSASVIAAVLNGHKTAKFMIKGRHLWARMYVPRYSTIQI